MKKEVQPMYRGRMKRVPQGVKKRKRENLNDQFSLHTTRSEPFICIFGEDSSSISCTFYSYLIHILFLIKNTKVKNKIK